MVIYIYIYIYMSMCIYVEEVLSQRLKSVHFFPNFPPPNMINHFICFHPPPTTTTNTHTHTHWCSQADTHYAYTTKLPGLTVPEVIKTYPLGTHFRGRRILTPATCWRRETFPAQFVKACAVNADGYEEGISDRCSYSHSRLPGSFALTTAKQTSTLNLHTCQNLEQVYT